MCYRPLFKAKLSFKDEKEETAYGVCFLSAKRNDLLVIAHGCKTQVLHREDEKELGYNTICILLVTLNFLSICKENPWANLIPRSIEYCENRIKTWLHTRADVFPPATVAFPH
jgi:hypothetical protein